MMHERPDELMSNPRADRVKKVAQLSGRSAVRARRGQFLVEGPQSVREALNAHLGQLSEQATPASQYWVPGQIIDQIYYSPELPDADPALFGMIAELRRSRGAFIRPATDEVLAAMSDAVTPQHVIAVANIPDNLELPATADLVAGLIRVQDPGNVGTLIRTADATGADYVFISEGTVDPFNPKVVRSTAGSLFHLALHQQTQPLEEISYVWKNAQMQVLAADGYATTSLETLPQETLATPTVWLFGNEAQGLTPAEVEIADDSVAVPLYGNAESLNVATAATVCLYSTAMAQNS